MIAQEKEDVILALFRAGFSLRKIANRTGVSRGAVTNVIKDYTGRKRVRNLYIAPEYCERCGGPLPCISCAREMRANSGNTGREEDLPSEIEPELEGPDRLRYLQLRREFEETQARQGRTREYVVGEARERLCLKCNQPFLSESPANRICLSCQRKNTRNKTAHSPKTASRQSFPCYFNPHPK